MAILIDSSLLIGIAVDDHEHHEIAERWFTGLNDVFATCPITQGAVVRHIVRNGHPMKSAIEFLAALNEREEHEFWSDDLSFTDVPTAGVIGHRQVTDAYLAQLARHRGARIATLDIGLAAVHRDVAELVPTS